MCLTDRSFWNLFNVNEIVGDGVFFGTVVTNAPPVFFWELTNYVNATLNISGKLLAQVTFTS